MALKERIIIVGAGIAGLAAGIYARLNGFEVDIYEQHTIPGGLCTSWRRDGYLFDGSLQYVAGSGEGAEAYAMWRALGALDNRQFVHREEFVRYEAADGRQLVFYTDIERFISHLHELSPQDRRQIDVLAGALRSFARFDLPLDMPNGLTPESAEPGLKLLPHLFPVLRWNAVTLKQFASGFSDPLLREGLPHFFQFCEDDFPMTIFLMTLGLFHRKQAGYPVGGSLQFALGVARRLRGLGGRIHYRAPVDEILIEHRRAVGIRLENGEEHYANYVISAAPGPITLDVLLKGNFTPPKLLELYGRLKTSTAILQVSFGVRRDFSAEPSFFDFPLPQPVSLAGVTIDRLVLKHYAFDPTLAPEGGTVLSLWIEGNYEHWKSLHSDYDRYLEEEACVYGTLLKALERRYPGISEQVEARDIATPLTYERFTRNPYGSIHGWAINSDKMSMMMGSGMPKRLPGLENFMMIGQWVEPGGNVQLSAASGRDAIKQLCKQRRQAFVSERALPAAMAGTLQAVGK